MDHVVNGVAKFQREVFPAKADSFRELANGQNPEVLFITCADSRIDPNLITQTQPGELFICRNAGNVVPPHSNFTGGITASIEYAVAALGIEHIIVCGHTDCGAMKGALNPSSLEKLPHVKEWLGHCRAAVEVCQEQHGELGHEHLNCVTKENVALQIQHLKTHPSVAAGLSSGRIKLHGWIYNIETGEVLEYNQDTRQLEPVKPVEIESNHGAAEVTNASA